MPGDAGGTMIDVPRGPFVVVGSGSAGRRHAAGLRTLAPDRPLLVVRRAESDQPTAELDALGVRFVSSTAEAAAASPGAAVVASPAPHHRADVASLLSVGARVLVEKPVTASLGDALALRAVAGAAEVRVGYHLRVDDIAHAFGEAVRSLGEVHEIELRVGQHLAGWRPGVAAERSVSARQELGGGVLLELSHELDALLHLFGPATTVRAAVGVEGAPTDGAVETWADLEVGLASGASATIHLDMVSDPPVRWWRAEGSHGSVVADLLAGTVEVDVRGRRHRRQVAAGSRSRAGLRLLSQWLAPAPTRADPLATLDESIAVLALIDAARAAAVDRTCRDVLDPLASVAPGGLR